MKRQPFECLGSPILAMCCMTTLRALENAASRANRTGTSQASLPSCSSSSAFGPEPR